MPAEQRRAQLIDTATRLYASHGDALTTAEVAEAAGVAEGTLFRLFPDKESLIDACLHDALNPQSAIARIQALADEPSLDAKVQKLAEITLEHFRHALPVMHRAMERGKREGAPEAVGGMFVGLIMAVAMVLGPEVERRKLTKDTGTLARLLIGICQSVVWQEFFEGVQSVGTNDFVSIFLDGCRGSSEEVAG